MADLWDKFAQSQNIEDKQTGQQKKAAATLKAAYAQKDASYDHKMAELRRQAREEERAAEAAEMESLKPKKK